MTILSSELEVRACSPVALDPNGFNPVAQIPFGLAPGHIQAAMQEFLDFIGFVSESLQPKGIPRLESFLMPANFSSIVGEFMAAAIPKYCTTLVKNTYHNGHPDLIPVNHFANNAVQHDTAGIEIKASRHTRGWQGHNAEACWLMVFVFDSNTSRDTLIGVPPKPFRFVAVYGAQLDKEDWNFSGRSETSRRTITASVTKTGYAKMSSNWIYRALG